jgi:hypothetical protein
MQVGAGQSVTLISGDQVTLAPSGNGTVITRAPGRANITFNTYRVNGHLNVVPEDARQLVAKGQLDNRLFDVTGLMQAGYTDATTHAVPLIVSGALSGTGVQTTQRFSAIGASAVTVAKQNTAADWAMIKSSAATQRISLDGMRSVQSTSGAQAAVRPGAQSAGTSVGASLLANKLCANNGQCPESAVLAGMQSAVQHGARVVNPGVTSQGSGANDVVQTAVKALSASTGARFVTPAAATSSATVPAAAPTFTVTIKHIGTDGKAATHGESMLVGLTNSVFDDLWDPSGTVTASVPAGQYMVVGDVAETVQGKTIWHRVVQPLLTVTGNTTVKIDARTTRPMHTSVPNAAVRPTEIQVGVERHYGNGQMFVSSLSGTDWSTLFTANLGPQVAPADVTGFVLSVWGVPGPNGDFKNTPVIYNLLGSVTGHFMTGYNRVVKSNKELAELDTSINAQVANRDGDQTLFGGSSVVFDTLGLMIPFTLPAKTVHFVDGGDVTWSGAFGEHVVGPDGVPYEVTAVGQANQTYVNGFTYATRWNAGPYGPLFDFNYHAGRTGDTMWFGLPMFSDQDQHRGGSLSDSAYTKVFRNGQLIAQSDALQLQWTAQPGLANFKIEKFVTRPSFSGLSTTVSGTWTFKSDTTTALTSLPLWVVRYHPVEDSHNEVAYSPTTTIPIELQSQPTAPVGNLNTLTVQISGDHGQTWEPAVVEPAPNGRYVAMAPTPANASGISLRSYLTDTIGDTESQTIIDAWHFSGTVPSSPNPSPIQHNQPSCAVTPTVPTLDASKMYITSTATNNCTVFAIFWLMQYDATNETGWRTIYETWMNPTSTAENRMPCFGDGTHVYKAVEWDSNMMGYHITPPVTITC